MLVRSLNLLAHEPVSHNPEIPKQVWIRNGEVPNLTQVSRAVLPPGECCGAHSHPDMWEMFIVEQGEGLMTVDDRQVALVAGVCLVVFPGETHELTNSSDRPLGVLTVGWTNTDTRAV